MKKKKKKLESFNVNKGIPSEKLVEITDENKKEMRRSNRYFTLRQSNPESSILVVKPGINEWLDLTYKKKGNSKKSGLIEPFSIKEGLEDPEKPNILGSSAAKTTEVKSKPGDRQMEASDVDNHETQCAAIQSCGDLVGTKCGYCATTDEFYFGTAKGPKTQVCLTKDWGMGKEQCEKVKDRKLCAAVKDCGGLVGEPGKKCGYCPTAGVGMVAKRSGSKWLPKYSDDKCTSASGLLKNDTCAQYLRDNPCSTPRYQTGPHSEACIRKLWKDSKCTTEKVMNNDITAYTSIMKPYVEIGNQFRDVHEKAEKSTELPVAINNQKLCYGKSTIDPCDSKFPMNYECRKKQFTSAGCETSGKGYPSDENVKTWPTTENLKQKIPGISAAHKTDILNAGYAYDSYLQKQIDKANADVYDDEAYKKKLRSSLYCYGDVPKGPDPMRTGDFVEYDWDGTIFRGYVFVIDKQRVGCLWTYFKRNGEEHRREGKSQDEQKLNWGWPNYPAAGDWIKNMGDKDFYVPKSDLKIIKKCPKGNAVSLCNVTCYTIMDDLKSKYPRPRDCIVSPFSAWGACSKPCATGYPYQPGYQVRTRTVKYPARRGGVACPHLSETQQCNKTPCKHQDFNEEVKANFKGVKIGRIGIFNNNYIHIKQIQVFDVNGNNVALNKKASQSSNYSTFSVSNVTKNNSSYAHTDNRSSATNKKFNKNEWIIVDLDGTFEIIKVVLKKTSSDQTQNAGAQLILMNSDGAEIYNLEPGDTRRTVKNEMQDSEFLFGSDNFPYSLEDKRGKCDEVRNNDYVSTRDQSAHRRKIGRKKYKTEKGKWHDPTYNNKWKPTSYHWKQNYRAERYTKGGGQWCRWQASTRKCWSQWNSGWSYGCWRSCGWWWWRWSCWSWCWHGAYWSWKCSGNHGYWRCTTNPITYHWRQVKTTKSRLGVKEQGKFVKNYKSVKKAGYRDPSKEVQSNPNATQVEWKKGSKYEHSIDGLKQAATDTNDYKVDKTAEGNCLGSMFRLNEYYKKTYGGGDCESAYDQKDETTHNVKTLGQCAQACVDLGEKCNRFSWGDPNKPIGPTGKKGLGCRISNSVKDNNVFKSDKGYCTVDSDYASLAGNSYAGKFNEYGGQIYDKKEPNNKEKPPDFLYPKFIGWYKDSGSRRLPTRADSNPRDWTRQTFRDDKGGHPRLGGMFHQLTNCAGKCSVKGKKYFGLQYWGECWCGDDLTKAKSLGTASPESWASQNGWSSAGYFGGWKNKIYRTKKMVYSKTRSKPGGGGTYNMTAAEAAAECARNGEVLCPKRVLVGANDSAPDRSVCNAGYTADAKRLYPMMYKTGGCGNKGVNVWGTGKGSAHCCKFIDEEPDGRTREGSAASAAPALVQPKWDVTNNRMCHYNYTPKTIVSNNVADCKEQCIKDTSCTGFSYAPAWKQCRLENKGQSCLPGVYGATSSKYYKLTRETG